MISVVTATYNRSYCIEKLYNSLCEQLDHDFEWVIIDDGSTDNTELLVDDWKRKESSFPIYYRKKINAGKHRAINDAMQIVHGTYVFLVDSDDWLTKDAIYKIKSWIAEIDNDNSFAGVSGCKGLESKTERLLGHFPEGVQVIDATNIERVKKKLAGDKAEVYRTDILRRYPFPEFEGEKFLPEAAVWDQIAKDGYRIRWHKDVIYICEYRSDGLTSNSDKYIKDNFKGYTYVRKKSFRLYPFPYNWVVLISYIDVAKDMNLPRQKIIYNMEIKDAEYYFACFLYIFWKKIQKFKNRGK